MKLTRVADGGGSMSEGEKRVKGDSGKSLE